MQIDDGVFKLSKQDVKALLLVLTIQKYHKYTSIWFEPKLGSVTATNGYVFLRATADRVVGEGGEPFSVPVEVLTAVDKLRGGMSIWREQDEYRVAVSAGVPFAGKIDGNPPDVDQTINRRRGKKRPGGTPGDASGTFAEWTFEVLKAVAAAVRPELKLFIKDADQHSSVPIVSHPGLEQTGLHLFVLGRAPATVWLYGVMPMRTDADPLPELQAAREQRRAGK